MNKSVMTAIFATGLAAAGWVGWGFIGHSPLALAMTVMIAATYLLGAWELMRYRTATASLTRALDTHQEPPALEAWLESLDPALRHPVRQRIEGERVALPGPALTPYLVGLLVMLGMLGTFVGMVVTFHGAVFALEASGNLESIRNALAAPIKGLGLSFGTSVAGVATSAALGLLSALSRRERLQAVRQLDARIPTLFRAFSSAQRREDTLQALQAQAQALPLIADRLQAMMEGLERRHSQLNDQLLAQQQGFHKEASAAYTQLAQAVGASLQDSLSTSAQQATAAMRPVVEQAMATLAQESQRTHERLREHTSQQLQNLSAQWEGTARKVADTWARALDQQTNTQGALATQFEGALQTLTQAFDDRSKSLVDSLHASAAQQQAAQAEVDQRRLQGWEHTMQDMARNLAAEWQRAGTHTLTQQQEVGQALERTAQQMDRQLQATTQAFAQQAEALVTTLQATVAEAHAAQRSADAQRLADWTQSMRQMAQTISGEWQSAGTQTAEQHQATSAALAQAAQQIEHRLQTANSAFEQRSEALLAALQATAADAQQAQRDADTQRLADWSQSLENLAHTLSAEWQRAATQTVEQQRVLVQTLEETATQVSQQLNAQVERTLGSTTALMEQSDALLRTRIDTEAQWVQAQGQRMEALTQVWRDELVALRDAEAVRGQAAVDRLETLQAAVAEHLATLGAALEAPLTRLLQTASDVPQAAAEVITQLRQEMTRLGERDNLALAERTAMTHQLGTLLQSVNDAAVQQRAAIDALVGSAAQVLEQAGQQFAQALGAQADKVDEVAAQVAASAIELSSLGESFQHGVGLFSASNDKLVESLQGMEGALRESMGRSDEQLAYYVAQAREVIDLSISAQQGIVEDLRRLHGRATAEQGVPA